MNIPIRYLPIRLTNKDQKIQQTELKKSRNLYKSGKYYTRKRVASFKTRPSKHIKRAQKIYGITKMTPNRQLSNVTGCTVSALQKIVNKGEGAYFSSGSRPNQTAQSWGLARLASSLTAGKSAAVDFEIIETGCKHSGKAYNLAKTAKRKYGFGRSSTKHRQNLTSKL